MGLEFVREDCTEARGMWIKSLVIEALIVEEKHTEKSKVQNKPKGLWHWEDESPKGTNKGPSEGTEIW